MTNDPTFEVVDDVTKFDCGCNFTTIGKNFLIAPCSLGCQVYKYILEASKKQGNTVSYQLSQPKEGDA